MPNKVSRLFWNALTPGSLNSLLAIADLVQTAQAGFLAATTVPEQDLDVRSTQTLVGPVEFFAPQPPQILITVMTEQGDALFADRLFEPRELPTRETKTRFPAVTTRAHAVATGQPRSSLDETRVPYLADPQLQSTARPIITKRKTRAISSPIVDRAPTPTVARARYFGSHRIGTKT